MSDLPVETFTQAAPHLRRPFSPAAIKFRPAPGNLVLPYIDARVVIERLNAVIPQGWSTEFEPYPGGKQIICHLTIDRIRRSDVGSQATGDRVDPVKAGYSDSFKRAAVHFGIGVSVYALKKVWISDMPENATKEVGSNKKSKVLTEAGETWLRRGYRNWLKSEAGKHFGDELSHGDEEGAVGDLEAAPSSEPGEPVEAPSLEDEALRSAIQTFYENRVDGRKLSKAKFTAQLKAADTPEKLKKLQATLEGAVK